MKILPPSCLCLPVPKEQVAGYNEHHGKGSGEVEEGGKTHSAVADVGEHIQSGAEGQEGARHHGAFLEHGARQAHADGTEYQRQGQEK